MEQRITASVARGRGGVGRREPSTALIEPDATNAPFGQPVSLLVIFDAGQVGKCLPSTLRPYSVDLMSRSTPARSPEVPGVTLMFCLNETFCGFFAVPAFVGLNL